MASCHVIQYGAEIGKKKVTDKKQRHQQNENRLRRIPYITIRLIRFLTSKACIPAPKSTILVYIYIASFPLIYFILLIYFMS